MELNMAPVVIDDSAYSARITVLADYQFSVPWGRPLTRAQARLQWQ